MKPVKLFEQYVLEAKQFGTKEIMKELKNKDDWGDLADQVYMKSGNMVVVDTWFYGQDRAMKQLEDSWKKGGSNYDYWNKEHGVDFKIVDTFSEVKAEGRHKKLTKDGIVGIVLKVTANKILEANDISIDGHLLNQLADNQIGGVPATEFQKEHDLDLKAITRALNHTKEINQYELRDIINGTASKRNIRSFLKLYKNK